MPASWFNLDTAPRLTAAAPRVGRIKIHDMIGGWGIGAEEFVRQLENLGDLDELEIDINSPGGGVNAGLTIYDAIRNHKARAKRGVVTGMAASMASVILLAADDRHIAENGRVMLHRVTGNAAGTSEEMQKAAELAKKFEDRIRAIYTDRTGQSKDAVDSMMNSLVGTWLIGSEAVDKGFAHKVLGGIKAQNFQGSWSPFFHFSHAALFDNSASPTPAPTPSSTSTSSTAMPAASATVDPHQKKREAFKAAGLTDPEIEAALKSITDAEAATAQAKKAAALKAAGLSDEQVAKVLAEAAAATALEARKAELKAAGLSDAEITAALALQAETAAKAAKAKGKGKAKKKDDDEEEEEEEDEDDDEEENRIAKAVNKALGPVTTELASVQKLIKSGVLAAAGGAVDASKGKGAKDAPEFKSLSPLQLINQGNRPGAQLYEQLKRNGETNGAGDAN